MLNAQMSMPLNPLPDNLEVKLTKSEQRLFNSLPIGKENAMTAHDLSILINVDERTIKAIVHRLRLKHCDIGSSRSSANYGYYRFKNVQEYLEYMASANKQSERTDKVLEAMQFTPLALLLRTKSN